MYTECMEAARGGEANRHRVRVGRRKAEPPVYREPGGARSCETEDLESHPQGDKADEGRLEFFSWNIGGKPAESALAAIANSNGKVDSAIFALQELPRVQPGWRTTYVEERTILQFRGEDQWRGNGICFRTGAYEPLRRKANDLGVWVRLREVSSGREFWVCSARLSTGVSDDVTAEEMRQVLRCRPPTTLPSIVLADFNTQLKWTSAAGPLGQVLPSSGRADFLCSEVERQGYTFHAPLRTQWDTPTSRPRRRNAVGRQIDGVVTKGTKKPVVTIEEGSFRQTGGDHERIRIELPVRGEGPPAAVWDTRPRVMAGEIPAQPGLNQTRVEQLAMQYTQPRRGTRYRDPPAVRRAFRTARQSDTEEAWKAAQQARRKARDEWHQAKVVRAGQGGWQEVKDLQGRQGTEWAVHLTEEAYSQGKDPLVWTAQHFAEIFREAAAQQEVQWTRDQPSRLRNSERW